jgi:hypothetical protein
MTVIGRINGPMLKENLERQGVDLSFDTNLLYLDVNNKRIGINNSLPSEELDINGNVLIANNILIANTGISTLATNANITFAPNGSGKVILNYLSSGRIPLVSTNGSIVDNANLTFNTDTLITVNANIGNIRTSNNSIVSTNTNGNINITPNGSGIINSTNLAITNLTSGRIVYVGANGILQDNANLTFDGTSIVITGALTLDSAIVGNISFVDNTITTTVTNSNLNLEGNGTGDVVIDSLNIVGTTANRVLFTNPSNLVSTDSEFTYDSVSNILLIGNLTLANNTIEAVITNGNINLTTNGTGGVIITSSASLQLPSGNVSQRPLSSTAGMIRFNNVDNELEYYDGATWTPILNTATSITSDTFNGDGSTLTFTLSQTTTTAGALISINGVLQKPTVSYTVSGTQLTFAEAPISTDVIEARTVVTATSLNQIADNNTFVQANDSAPNIVANVNGSTVLTLTSSNATFTGNIIGTGSVASIINSTPASSSASGVKGQIAYDNNYVYICVATNSWIRADISASF